MKDRLRLTCLLVCVALAGSGGAAANEPSPEPVADEAGRVVDAEATCEASEPEGQAVAKDSASACKSKCNQKCSGASNKAKCVGTCRRACDA